MLACVFGYLSARTDFCTMGALSDAVNIGDWTRLRMWMLAVGVAVLGAAALEVSGSVDLDRSIYRGARLLWLSNLSGGAALGFGMVLASGCASKTLIRIGSGSLKSLIVAIVLALSAEMALHGLPGVFRVGVLDAVAVDMAGLQDLGRILGTVLHLEGTQGRILAALLAGGGLVAGVLALPAGRRPDVVLAGVGVGLLVTAGWWLTGSVGFMSEHPETLQPAWVGTNSGRPESLSLVGPQAYALELLTFWTDRSRGMSFGIASVAGVVAGSFLRALATRSLRLETFRDPEDTLNHIAGGALMGFGGVTALGCTIGQGVSGLSTLAVGSIIACAGIVAGALAAFRYLQWRS